MPFWSDRAWAAQCAVDEWEDYEATQIELEEFVEGWLVGMAKDGLLVGVNWNVQLIGREIEPAILRGELIARLDGDHSAGGPMKA